MRYFNVLKTNENHPRGDLPILRLSRLHWLRLSGRSFISKGHAINLRVGVKAMTKQKRKLRYKPVNKRGRNASIKKLISFFVTRPKILTPSYQLLWVLKSHLFRLAIFHDHYWYDQTGGKNKLYLKEHNMFYCRGRKKGTSSQESPVSILG